MAAHGVTRQEPRTALGEEPGRATRPRRPSAWTASALRDVIYAGAVVLWSTVAFAILVTDVSVTVSLLAFVVGAFVWVGFAYVVRWTTLGRPPARGMASHRVRAGGICRPAARGFVPAAAIVMAYLSMPIWSWAISDPDDLYGPTNLGLSTVDTLGEGVAVTANGLALAPLALRSARGYATARAARILALSARAEISER